MYGPGHSLDGLSEYLGEGQNPRLHDPVYESYDNREFSHLYFFSPVWGPSGNGKQLDLTILRSDVGNSVGRPKFHSPIEQTDLCPARWMSCQVHRPSPFTR